MEPHNFHNIGSDTARVIGFFSSPNVISTLEKAFLPLKFKEFDTELSKYMKTSGNE
jgi:hypothetical protein